MKNNRNRCSFSVTHDWPVTLRAQHQSHSHASENKFNHEFFCFVLLLIQHSLNSEPHYTNHTNHTKEVGLFFKEDLDSINYLDSSPLSAYDYIQVVNIDAHSPHIGHPTVTAVIILGCNSEGR